jgi:hypothetical protein
MKSNKFIIMSLLLLFFMAESSEASWLIYHKPEFKGRVIDAETKEPIEGAVVVVVYNKFLPGLTGTGGNTNPMKIKETLTDKYGEFNFPSYTTLIQPLSTEDKAEFIFYKPGYGGPIYTSKIMTPLNEEKYFAKEIGSTGELIGPTYENFKVTFGMIELRKVKTREERLLASSISITRYDSKDLPLLYKALNEEYKSLGIGISH